MNKLVYIISEINKSLAFEWIAQSFNKRKFDITFILLGKSDSELANQLRKDNVQIFEFPLGGKFSLMRSFFSLLTTLRKIKPDIIHTHLFYANILGLSAGWILRIPKRI